MPTSVAMGCLLDVNVLDQRTPMRAPRVYDEKTSAASTVHSQSRHTHSCNTGIRYQYFIDLSNETRALPLLPH